jgi:hypothetical protein
MLDVQPPQASGISKTGALHTSLLYSVRLALQLQLRLGVTLPYA